MAEGPQDELTLTENAQPAIMANALATLRVPAGRRRSAKGEFVAGHSLGEYTALARGGGVRRRDDGAAAEAARPAMQAAVPVGQGAMAALLGADLEIAQASPRKRRRARSAPSPTTMIRGRW
jgi:[acyl-carrier-protein] S-malonyltransferase